jgi:hypothetical protein
MEYADQQRQMHHHQHLRSLVYVPLPDEVHQLRLFILPIMCMTNIMMTTSQVDDLGIGHGLVMVLEALLEIM